MAQHIQFVGDPFVDAGVAALERFIGKPCAEFTRGDLAGQATELERIYSKKAWTGYLTVHFPNSCWCNATMGTDKKKAGKDALLRSFDLPVIPEKSCVYCRRPAQHLADRSVIPLLTGAVTMTCGPGGEPGLPVCSSCQFAVQFYPLATLKVNGRPLFWWTPDHAWMHELTLRFAEQVERVIEASPEQAPNLSWPSTRLLETVQDVLESPSGKELPLVDLVACHATNFGSRPDYEEIRINRGLMEFLRIAEAYPAYHAILNGAWETAAAKPRKAKKASPGKRAGKSVESKRNSLYEEFGRHLRNADGTPSSVVSRFFAPYAARERGVFELTCHFARKVLHMTQEQIIAIRELADNIAGSPKAEDHLDRLFQRRGLLNYIRILADISDRMKRGEEKPLAMDTILRAFNLSSEDEPPEAGAAIARELILIRLIEVLPQEQVKRLKPVESDGNEE
jgi:CRISPR-associated protein Cst1